MTILRVGALALAASAVIAPGVWMYGPSAAGTADELATDVFAQPVELEAVSEISLAARARQAGVRLGESDLLLRIGEGPDAPPFGHIADVAPSANGDTVYVLDAMEGVVSAFGRGGEPLFRFGRKGAGPGEFRNPEHLLVLPWNGSVGVWDGKSQLLSLFAPDGGFLGTLNVAGGERKTTSRTIQRVRAFGGGFVYEIHSDPLLEVEPSGRGALIRTDTLGLNADTLLRFAVVTERAMHVENSGGTATTWLYPPYYSPRPAWDLLADGTVVFAPGGPPEAYRLPSEGQVSRLRWADVPQRVSRRDRLRLVEDARDRRQLGSPVTPLAALERVNRSRFAQYRPAVTGLLVLSPGETWVQRFDTEEEWSGSSRTWDRVGADFQPLSPVVLPSRFRPTYTIGRVIYGVARDSDDVESVEIYRMP